MRTKLSAVDWVLLALFFLALAVLECCTTGCALVGTPEPPTWIIVGNTGSMRPTFVGGELREVQRKQFADLAAGDIVLTYFSGEYHIHRLLSRRNGRWTTKGDASAVPDPHTMTADGYGGCVVP